MRADKLHCGDLLEVVAVMHKGNPIKSTPWARGGGLGLGVAVCSQSGSQQMYWTSYTVGTYWN